MNSKIIFKHKTKLENTQQFTNNIEKEIDFYLNQGYKIISSNITNDTMYAYIYILLVKE